MRKYENLDLADMEGEIWKPINGHEKLYQVSNFGRVKSLGREVKLSYARIGNAIMTYPSAIMKQSINAHGYLVVSLTDENGEPKVRRVHRLAGIAFLDNPENKPTVDHMDTDKLNNELWNLQWATSKEQVDTNKKNNIVHWRVGAEHAQSKTVYHYNLQGELIGQYGGCGDAHRKTGVSLSQINKVCKKQFDFVGENVFSYEELPKEYFNREFKKRTQKERIVIKYDLMWNEIERYFNCGEASEKNGLQYTGIHCAASGKTKSCGGFRWNYANENQQ